MFPSYTDTLSAIMVDWYLPLFADLPNHACGTKLRVRFVDHDGRYIRYDRISDSLEAVVVATCPHCADRNRALSRFHHENCTYYGRVRIPLRAIHNILPRSEPRIILEMMKHEMKQIIGNMTRLIRSHYSPLDMFLCIWGWDGETGTPLSYMLKHEDLVESTYVG